MKNRTHRLIFFLPFLLCLIALAACDVNEMSSLPELSKPFVGVYACEKLTLGDKDMLSKFEKISLELEYDGTFELSYLGIDGAEGSYGGKYSVSPDNNAITMSMNTGARSVSRTFRIEKGVILIDGNVLGKLLYAEFRLP